MEPDPFLANGKAAGGGKGECTGSGARGKARVAGVVMREPRDGEKVGS